MGVNQEDLQHYSYIYIYITYVSVILFYLHYVCSKKKVLNRNINCFIGWYRPINVNRAITRIDTVTQNMDEYI